jgi:hypothetical protein
LWRKKRWGVSIEMNGVVIVIVSGWRGFSGNERDGIEK